MKINPVRGLIYAGALCALVVTAQAQIYEFRATINAAQETPATTSPATGTAQMFYNFSTNTFDLYVTINNISNIATASHIHEGAVGAPGGVVTPLSNLTEAPFYTRSGTTLTGAFLNVKHGGSALTLLQGGAYFNIHSSQFPNGEVRGQLIAQPIRLYANMTVAQEAAANPTLNFAGVNDFGGAIVTYNPADNTVKVRSSIYNFTNTFNNSHFHESPPGVSGPVVVTLGNNPNTTFANGGSYSNVNGVINGTFDIPYTGGDPIKLLTGGAYLNYHSTTFGGGELRGQVQQSLEVGDRTANRLVNLSVRGFVGVGEQALITGIVVTGPEPVRVLITAKGPSLTALGVTGALANPKLTLFDSSNRTIATNDDVGTLAAGSELAAIPGSPRNALESALLVVLPPGNYTAAATSSTATGTGVALLEVYDVRTVGAITQ